MNDIAIEISSYFSISIDTENADRVTQFEPKIYAFYCSHIKRYWLFGSFTFAFSAAFFNFSTLIIGWRESIGIKFVRKSIFKTFYGRGYNIVWLIPFKTKCHWTEIFTQHVQLLKTWNQSKYDHFILTGQPRMCYALEYQKLWTRQFVNNSINKFFDSIRFNLSNSSAVLRVLFIAHTQICTNRKKTMVCSMIGKVIQVNSLRWIRKSSSHSHTYFLTNRQKATAIP